MYLSKILNIRFVLTTITAKLAPKQLLYDKI